MRLAQLKTDYLEGMDDESYAYYNATLSGTSTFVIIGGEIKELTGELQDLTLRYKELQQGMIRLKERYYNNDRS